MERGTCVHLLRLGAGVAVLLTYASAAGAFDAAAYYPLESGSRWTYDVESRLTIASGAEVLERYLTGSSEEVVSGPSPLSKVGSTVYKVRSRIQLGEVDSEPIIDKSFTTHLSAHKKGILVHGVDSTVFPYPSLLLSADPRLNEPVEFSVEVMDEVPTINELVTIKQLGTHTAYYVKVRTPDGKSVAMTESETYQLIRFEP